jgi:predicted dienelactone hydrolase
MPIGFSEGLSYDHTRTNWAGDGPRPLRWSMWYRAIDTAQEKPLTDPSWFELGPIARDAEARLPAEPYRVVLLSHGAGGVATGLEWLARRLAREGFVALAVNHHGNTGSEPYRAEGFLCLWERASDLSALFDCEDWRARLCGEISSSAVAAGFSAGAYTAMLLAGARVAYSQFEDENPERSPIRGPREFPDLADKIQALFEMSPAFNASWNRRRESYKDNRIKAVLALAPGRSVRGFSLESLREIEVPVHIVVGEGDAAAAPDRCAGWLHTRTSGSSFEMLRGGAGHYVFLPKPTPLGLETAPDIFRDARTVDRGAVHDAVASTAISFFRNIT